MIATAIVLYVIGWVLVNGFGVYGRCAASGAMRKHSPGGRRFSLEQKP